MNPERVPTPSKPSSGPPVHEGATKPGQKAVHPTLGHKLRLTLEWRGLRAYELARAIGVEKSAVSNWVNGRETPNYPRVSAMAEVLDVPVEFLWDHGVPIILSPSRGIDDG